ncbi:MAG: DUF748 domain-containing protein [Alistipes sp.]
MKTFFKILIACILLLVAIAVTAALMLPSVAKKYIEEHSKELVGRRITIEQLRFNILTGDLRINHIAMREVDDTTTFASLGEFYTKIHLLPLLKQEVHIDAIRISQPDVYISQNGSSFNFDDLLTRFMPKKDSIDSEPSRPWKIDIDTIKLHDGHLLYKDLQRDITWGFNNLDVDIPGLHLSGHERTDMGVVFNFSRGGSLRTTLAFEQATSNYDLNLILTNLSLKGTAVYFQQLFDIGSVEGLMSINLHVKGNAEHLLDLRTNGTAAVAQLKLKDTKERHIISVDTLNFDLADGNLQTMKYKIHRIFASGITTQFEIYKNGSNNIMRLLKPVAKRPTDLTTTVEGTQSVTIERETPAETIFNFTIGEIDLQRGTVLFADHSFETPFRYHLSSIHLRGRNIDFGRHSNEITIDAKLQRTGSARIHWKGSLQNIDNHDIQILLSNINLTDFTPYCEHFTAYPITGGNLTFRSQNIISNRYINGSNHLDMYQCTVDKKRKDMTPEFKVPLRLGLYILKDRKDHVKIDLPVRGSIDAPEFSYRKIVMKALGNVLLKVVTAPFSFLFGHGGDNLEYININPLQYTLTTEQYSTLDKIAEVIKDKPKMKITLTQHVNYSDALNQQAENNLKMAYYNSTKPTIEKLTMLDFERIQETDVKSEAVKNFADSLLSLRGIDGSALHRGQKAMILYSDVAETQLKQILERRNQTIREYMTTMQRTPATSLIIKSAPETEMKRYNGKNRYTIDMEAEGESVDVSANSDAADKNTSAATETATTEK